VKARGSKNTSEFEDAAAKVLRRLLEGRRHVLLGDRAENRQGQRVFILSAGFSA
jgi:hypothetical protein